MLRGMLDFSTMKIRVPQVPLNSQILRRHTDVSKHMSVLYHFTSIDRAISILQQKQFKLSTAGGTTSETSHQGGYQYYLSTTRSKLGRFTQVESYNAGAVFTLNAGYFSKRYKIRPVDYWGQGWDGKRESEDRILSNSSTMSIDPSQAILSIHIYERNQDSESNNRQGGSEVRKLLILAKKCKIPAHVYGDHKAFLAQDMRKAQSHKELIQSFLKQKQLKSSSYADRKEGYAKQDVYPFIELMRKNESKHLSPFARKQIYNILYHNFNNDVNASLAASMHNGKSTKAVSKLITEMKTFGASDPKDMIRKLTEKWAKIREREEAKYKKPGGEYDWEKKDRDDDEQKKRDVKYKRKFR